MAANFQYENIVTDGLILNLDAGFVGSYPTTNTTWYDLSSNGTNFTLIWLSKINLLYYNISYGK
jgi:hypothetical protein